MASVHRIESGRFVCTAKLNDPCRNYPGCECEVWDPDLHGDPPAAGHESAPQPECWLAPWLDFELGDTYEQDDHGDAHGMTFPDGEVDHEFHGDYVTWFYVDPFIRPHWDEEDE